MINTGFRIPERCRVLLDTAFFVSSVLALAGYDECAGHDNKAADEEDEACGQWLFRF